MGLGLGVSGLRLWLAQGRSGRGFLSFRGSSSSSSSSSSTDFHIRGIQQSHDNAQAVFSYTTTKTRAGSDVIVSAETYARLPSFLPVAGADVSTEPPNRKIRLRPFSSSAGALFPRIRHRMGPACSTRYGSKPSAPVFENFLQLRRVQRHLSLGGLVRTLNTRCCGMSLWSDAPLRPCAKALALLPAAHPGFLQLCSLAFLAFVGTISHTMNVLHCQPPELQRMWIWLSSVPKVPAAFLCASSQASLTLEVFWKSLKNTNPVRLTNRAKLSESSRTISSFEHYTTWGPAASCVGSVAVGEITLGLELLWVWQVCDSKPPPPPPPAHSKCGERRSPQRKDI